jgi:uncharacterized Ntn-hydrolase superfamily protein
VTFSIVARDGRTGQLGVAVASHFLAAGRLAPWARAGVGAVATQAFVDPSYGPLGLDLMAAGTGPHEALDRLRAADPDAGQRQVALLAATGGPAVHTGADCYPHAGHAVGPAASAQGNMLAAPGIPEGMLAAYEATAGDLAERLLAALRAAEVLGGDARGRQSASLLVVDGSRGAHAGAGVAVDLRVDDHPDPVAELGRLYDLHRAYALVGVVFVRGTVTGDRPPPADVVDGALAALAEAARLLPGHPEPLLWSAVVAARAGRPEAGRALAAAVDARPALAAFLDRLRAQGVLPPTGPAN